MTPEQMLDLKDGDTVVLNKTRRYGMPVAGTILTRKNEWLDDESCVKFTYTVNDHDEYHFFKADEIDFIKE